MNRLAGSASLYLRQHADNPVDWWPWGEEAFDAARERDVPVFLSIGYAACHWCHVMAHECFEDDSLAALLNRVAVPIKVDREERPDVDALYMAATQALSGHGGWPMSVFLTHDARPFFAGTYFPPTPRGGQPGFGQVLLAVEDLWSTRRDELSAQAGRLTAAVAAEADVLARLRPAERELDVRDRLGALCDALVARADLERGGFGPAPKFPHAAWVEACVAGSRALGRDDARQVATRTLDAMARGGLFDHVGGGFARYSVDGEWHVPHFEKMLCDQALLARAYLRASSWLDEPTYASVARRTLDFVLDAMRCDGGFASSLDADAGGREGAHVVLRPADVRAALDAAGLGHLVEAAVARYELEPSGPVDGACVPRLARVATFEGTDDDGRVRSALLAWRATRPQPAMDDKVLLEWNAMLVAALAEAAGRLDEPRYGACAAGLFDTLRVTHRAGGAWRRRAGDDAPLATCADVAWLCEAAVALYEWEGDVARLEQARRLVDDLLDGYWDGAIPTAADPTLGAGLFQSHRDQGGLLVRPRDALDGATPAGAWVAAVACARLWRLSGDGDVGAVARRLVELAGPLLEREPGAAATALEAAALLDAGVELAVPGPPATLLGTVRRLAPPWSVVAFGDGPLALLEGRDRDTLYVCRGTVCEAPVAELASVARALAEASRLEAHS